MKNSTLLGTALSFAFFLFASISVNAQNVSVSNGTDCNIVVELGFQSSTNPPCTSHTPVWVSVACNTTVNVPFPAGTDVFKGYQIDPSGDASTFGINVVYHCGTWDPTNGSPIGIINPIGCGSCGVATQTRWYNLGGGTLTADYAIRVF